MLPITNPPVSSLSSLFCELLVAWFADEWLSVTLLWICWIDT